MPHAVLIKGKERDELKRASCPNLENGSAAWEKIRKLSKTNAMTCNVITATDFLRTNIYGSKCGSSRRSHLPAQPCHFGSMSHPRCWSTWHHALSGTQLQAPCGPTGHAVVGSCVVFGRSGPGSTMPLMQPPQKARCQSLALLPLHTKASHK